jgi:hypothetical protein
MSKYTLTHTFSLSLSLSLPFPLSFSLSKELKMIINKLVLTLSEFRSPERKRSRVIDLALTTLKNLSCVLCIYCLKALSPTLASPNL